MSLEKLARLLAPANDNGIQIIVEEKKMTPEELELARSVAGQGWDVLVSGTRLESALDFIALLISLMSAAIVWWEADRRQLDLLEKALTSGVVWLVALFACALLFDVLLGVSWPEYCAIRDALG